MLFQAGTSMEIIYIINHIIHKHQMPGNGDLTLPLLGLNEGSSYLPSSGYTLCRILEWLSNGTITLAHHPAALLGPAGLATARASQAPSEERSRASHVDG